MYMYVYIILLDHSKPDCNFPSTHTQLAISAKHIGGFMNLINDGHADVSMQACYEPLVWSSHKHTC